MTSVLKLCILAVSLLSFQSDASQVEENEIEPMVMMYGRELKDREDNTSFEYYDDKYSKKTTKLSLKTKLQTLNESSDQAVPDSLELENENEHTERIV